MWLRIVNAGLIAGACLLTASLAQAAPPEWAMNDGQRGTLPPGLVSNAARVQSVPVPATLILFGAGLLAVPWLRARARRQH